MSVDVLGAGCVFPSGPGLGLADVALRTGLALVRRHPFFVDRSGQRVRVSCFADASLAFDVSRWSAIVDAALSDLASNMAHLEPAWLEQHRWQVWLVLPGANRAVSADALYDAIAPVLARWPHPLHQVELRLGGHATGVAALAAAAAACEAHSDRLALVLALDSQMDAVALHALEQRRLLHGAGEFYEGAVRANTYGRVPGEGAAALVLSAADATRRPEQIWCRLVGAASGHEEHLAGHDEPCTGAGLTETARRAIGAAGLGGLRLDSLTHDATGEPYRADEFGYTALRLAPVLAPAYQRITPALASADLGAASAVAHAALTAWRCRDGEAVGAAAGIAPGNGASDMGTTGTTGTPRAHLILSSSDDGERGALVLQSLPSTAQRIAA